MCFKLYDLNLNISHQEIFNSLNSFLSNKLMKQNIDNKQKSIIDDNKKDNNE